MGWEFRRGRRYCYRSVRVNGQPRRLYVGTGLVAEQYARQEAERRRQRQAQRDALRTEQARVVVADRALAELVALTGLLARAWLLKAGLHEHHGEWRRWKQS